MLEYRFTCEIDGKPRKGSALLDEQPLSGGEWYVAGLWLHAPDDPDGDDEPIQLIDGSRTYKCVLLWLLQHHRKAIDFEWERRPQEEAA